MSRRLVSSVALVLAVAGCGGKLAPSPFDAGRDAEHEASVDAEPDVHDAGAVDRYVPPPPVITVAQTQNSPIAVVSDGARVYWTNYGTGNGDGFIVSSAIGGGPQQRLVSGQNPWALAVVGGWVYWSSYGTGGANGTISKIPSDGGTPTPLATAQTYPWSIVLDDKNIYWTQRIEMGASISSTPLSFTGNMPVPYKVASYLLSPTGLSLHDGTLYWTDYDTNGDVFRVPTDGGNYMLVGGMQDHPFAVVTDDQNVYWSTYEAIVSVPLAGGTPTTLAAAAQRIISLAVDTSYVYWTDYYEGTVNEVPVKGGKVITLASGQPEAYGLGLDTKHVYWTTFGQGNVMQMDKYP